MQEGTGEISWLQQLEWRVQADLEQQLEEAIRRGHDKRCSEIFDELMWIERKLARQEEQRKRESK